MSDQCPFESTMCINDTAVRLDSGYINTLDDLGINSPRADALSFRKTLECAPITTQGFTKTYNSQNLTNDTSSLLHSIGQSLQGSGFTAFFYGPNIAFDLDATFVFDNSSLHTSAGSTLVPYRVHADTAGSTFTPIAQLNRTDGEVILLFLSNDALYHSPVTDPWFNAQRPVIDRAKVGPYTMYEAEQPVSVLGCVDQTEVCNPARPDGDNYTLLSTFGLLNNNQVSAMLQLNPRQAGILDRFLQPIQNSVDVMESIGDDGGLLASALTEYWASAHLPDDQWIRELEHWFATVLVFIQMDVVEYVTHYAIPAFNHWKTPRPAGSEWMCNSQIVQRNDYASFSVLGLAIILCFGGFLMAVNLILSTAWPHLRHRNARSKFRNERWKAQELLELQRVALKNQAEDEKHAQLTITIDDDGAQGAPVKADLRQTFSEASLMSNGEPTMSAPDRRISAATIDVPMQQEDFPDLELARLVSTGSR